MVMQPKSKFLILNLFLIVLTLSSVNSADRNAPQRNIHIQRYQGNRLVSFYRELQLRSVADCGIRCGIDSQCAAANFHTVSRKCQLSSDTFGTGSSEEGSEWEVLDRQVWYAFGDSEYKFVDSETPWAVAKEVCESHNAYLTDIASEEQNACIAYLIAENSPEEFWWTGGHDQDHHGDWIWLSGSPMTTPYINWNPETNEPNGFGTEFCMMLYQGFWHDGGCDGMANSVCKRP